MANQNAVSVSVVSEFVSAASEALSAYNIAVDVRGNSRGVSVVANPPAKGETTGKWIELPRGERSYFFSALSDLAQGNVVPTRDDERGGWTFKFSSAGDGTGELVGYFLPDDKSTPRPLARGFGGTRYGEYRNSEQRRGAQTRYGIMRALLEGRTIVFPVYAREAMMLEFVAAIVAHWGDGGEYRRERAATRIIARDFAREVKRAEGDADPDVEVPSDGFRIVTASGRVVRVVRAPRENPGATARVIETARKRGYAVEPLE